MVRWLFVLALFCAPLSVRFLAIGDNFFLYLSDILLAAGFLVFGITLWRSKDVVIPMEVGTCLPAGRSKQTTKSLQWFQVIVLAILATTFAATFFAHDPASALVSAWRTLCFAGLAYIIASGFLSVRSIVTALGLIFAGEGLLAVLQFFTGGSVGLSFFGESTFTSETLNVGKIVLGSGDVLVRAMGTLPHANILGGLCAIAFILFVTQCRVCMQKFSIFNFQFSNNTQIFISQFLFPIASFGLLAGAFFSFSRAAIAATAIVLLLLIVFSRQLRWVTLLLLSILVILTGIFWSAFTARVGEGTTAGLSRSAQIEQAIIIAKEHPFGVGRGQYVAALGELRPDLPAYARVPVHNFFLLKLVEEGPLVVLAWLSFFVFIFYHTIATRRFDLFLLATAIFLLAQIDHYFADSFAGELVFWVVIGILGSREASGAVKSPHA